MTKLMIQLEDHPFSAVCNCLFTIFADTPQTCRPSFPSPTGGHAIPWWQTFGSVLFRGNEDSLRIVIVQAEASRWLYVQTVTTTPSFSLPLLLYMKTVHYCAQNTPGLNHTTSKLKSTCNFNLLAPELFFLILAHPIYKMWIIQESNTLELWNKLHFEEKNGEYI